MPRSGDGVRVAGVLQVPGDKSLSHRALIWSALGTGTSRITGLLDAADIRSTAGALRSLGWEVPALAPAMTVSGRGLRPRGPTHCDVACGNSGTTARLMAGIAAARPCEARLDGDDSLRRRPMRRVADPLGAMGARVTWEGAEGNLPMTIRGGTLSEVAWESPVASAQVKSAILLAGLCAGVPVRIREPLPSRDHTERMLRSLGVGVELGNGWTTLEPAMALPAAAWHIPGDPSSAAFFVALAAGASRGTLTLTSVLLNPHRVGFLRVLERMGVVFDVHNEASRGGEPVGDLVVHAGPLAATNVEPREVPALIDEIPMLAALATRAEGVTEIRGAGELRAKESDRIATMVSNLARLGADVEELPDGLRVRGPTPVTAGPVTTHGDHRIAMSFAILGALAGVELAIDHPGVVDVSYPTFWHDLARVTA